MFLLQIIWALALWVKAKVHLPVGEIAIHHRVASIALRVVRCDVRNPAPAKTIFPPRDYMGEGCPPMNFCL
jgi:hypothetical protein